MIKKRLIARIDIKNEFVIKGIHLEGVRKIGDPHDLAVKYYEERIDEILFMDAVASLYGRNNLFDIIERSCRDVFVPITVGGGIRTMQDIERSLKAGADKVAINTQAVKTPQFIAEAVRTFGSQCIVASVEAKRHGTAWESYCDNGREHTGKDALSWCRELEELGAGELLVTSVDTEGTKKGCDLQLLQAAAKDAGIPVIGCGGIGSCGHVLDLFQKTACDAVAVASILHYNLAGVGQIKEALLAGGVQVRP
ncbi:imidazole glycerol phosphate synthase cyclase subunit [Geomonas subterranea]|uniref:IGP synthase cyclase subunit n=1 Tax=Geomonas subterranea TaxID=2847989 RepID=A0ABX8LE86_9BACT|nr:imidazole glycerol phosphate synthase cyclase subunit [Geomonas subterranea]QXE90365.1 imidazole glycerol phosphate synthase cyclase subunit [Geomonas subterranea]QXM07507.1 imidazole glycerol phosphate synthase cyclase subunit [Geomonas subterranea]